MTKAPLWHEMHDRLSAPWVARNSPIAKRFVTREELQAAWSGRLETFSQEVGLGLARNECGDVEKRFLKTLSILVAIGYESWPRFKKNFLDHRDMEGTPDRTDQILPIPRQELQSLGLGLQPNEAEHFETVQYRFIPVILKEELDPLVLTAAQPLPFLDPQPPILGSGACGTVYKEVIGARCLRTAEGLENSKERTVARKTMEPHSAEIEIENLIQCRKSDIVHKNIMTYLCIYKAEDKTHILYDYAETDLDKLLHEEEYHNHIPSSASLIPLLGNASALAKTLQFLHSGQWNKMDGRWIGCHMDLKPANILIVKTKTATTWKISDLGISKFQPDPHHVRQPEVLAKKSTKTWPRRKNGKYQAPEVHEKNKIGRKSDIWSLGCILIIITVRAVQSRDGLVKFTEALLDGYNDDFFHCDGRLKPVVDTWLSELALTNSPYVRELTNTLQTPAEDVTTMMKKLERIIRDMLEVEVASRCDAEKACDELENLSRKLEVKSKAYPGMKCDIEAALDLRDPASEAIYGRMSGTSIPFEQNHSQLIMASEPECLQNIIPKAHTFVQKELLVKMKEDKAIPGFQVAQRTQSELRGWLRLPGSALLCISGSQGAASMSMISKCVYAAASARSWTAVAYISPQPGEIERTPRDLLCRLTNSFISQLLGLEGKNSNSATGLLQPRTFGNDDEDISKAIQMISELLAQATRSCIFVIDNFRVFCPHDCEDAIKGHWHQMLQMLQHSAHLKQQESFGVAVKSLVRATGSVEMLKSLGATIVRVEGNGPSNINLKKSLDGMF